MRATIAKAKPPRPTKMRVKGDLVAPAYILRLMEAVGPGRAAQMIGTTPGTLHKARNAGLVSRPFEVAARGVWNDPERGVEADTPVDTPPPAAAPTADLGAAIVAPTSDGVVSFLVAVPADKAEVMRNAIKAMGGRIYVQQD